MNLQELFSKISGTNQFIEKTIIIILILLLTLIISKVSKRIIEKRFNRSSRLMKLDPTQFSFMKHSVSAIIYILSITAIIYTIPPLRALSVSILAGAGVFAVVIGFASQAAFSNIISGVFIIIFRPFRVDDRIKIGTDVNGIVEDITLRHTVIRNFENKRIIIPNSIISNENIENSSIGDKKICKFIDIGISYDSDIKKAKKIMRDECAKHPEYIDNRTSEDIEKGDEAIAVRVLGFGDSSVKLRAWVWSKDPPSAFKMGCDLNEAIKKRFDKEGIEIPFPYRTIVYKDKKK